MTNLDRQVAEALGIRNVQKSASGKYVTSAGINYWLEHFKPSTNWSQCGPLIEEYKIRLLEPLNLVRRKKWRALIDLHYQGEGETPLIAACRALVASKSKDDD